ncbi:MAG: hypothetical protein U1D30_19550 [Planctomycetota bacterium]
MAAAFEPITLDKACRAIGAIAKSVNKAVSPEDWEKIHPKFQKVIEDVRFYEDEEAKMEEDRRQAEAQREPSFTMAIRVLTLESYVRTFMPARFHPDYTYDIQDRKIVESRDGKSKTIGELPDGLDCVFVGVMVNTAIEGTYVGTCHAISEMEAILKKYRDAESELMDFILDYNITPNTDAT